MATSLHQTDEPVFHSRAMAEVVAQVHRYASARVPVILVGAVGTGKTYFAFLLHQWSDCPGPFLVVEAGELRGELGADLFFGHVRGAFTGAVTGRAGMVARAAGGTLLLDNFDCLDEASQIALLRVLEEGAYRTKGSDRELPAQVRVVAAFQQEPDALVAKGALRLDVRSRLGHCVARLPRLDERREDIEPLAWHFLSRCPEWTGLADGPTTIGRAAVEVLRAAAWPANVRDLREVVKAAYVNAVGQRVLELQHVPAPWSAPPRYVCHGDPLANQRAVEWALRSSGGDVKAAARLLGVNRNTLIKLRARLPKEGPKVGTEPTLRRKVGTMTALLP